MYFPHKTFKSGYGPARKWGIIMIKFWLLALFDGKGMKLHTLGLK